MTLGKLAMHGSGAAIQQRPTRTLFVTAAAEYNGEHKLMLLLALQASAAETDVIH